MPWARFRLPAVLTVLRLPLLLLSAGLCPFWALALEVQLEVSGDDELAGALRQASLVEALEENETPTGQEVLSAAKADYARLVAVLYDAGYFGPVVSIRLDGREASEIRAFDAASAYGRALITVETGPAFRFGQARVSPLAPDTTLPDGFRVGAPAGTRVIRSAVDGSVEAWRSAGHAKAQPVDQQITARYAERQLNVDVTLDPGPKLRFGDLTLNSRSNVRPERIRQIVGWPTGKDFDPAEVEQARERLQRTGTFRIVTFREAENPVGQALPFDLEITDRLPRSYGFGAEISSLEGLTLTGYWQHRNLFGGAERLRFEGEWRGIGGSESGEDYLVSLRYDRPATFGPHADYFALIELESLDEVNFSSDRIAITNGIVNRRSQRRRFTYGFGFEYAETDDDLGERDYLIFTLPASAEFDYRNSELDPTGGYYGFLELTPFLALDGTENGLRSTLDVRTYRQVSERLVLAVRGQLGSIIGPGLEDAPADFLFYSGGGGTVRGQPYQSLGVTLPGGGEVGGRSFVGLSGEARVKASDRISVVGFWDAGYIGEEVFPDGTSGEWHSGAGLGLRYDTGIGPIRVDVGLPVSGPGDNDGIEFYIGIGQAF